MFKRSTWSVAMREFSLIARLLLQKITTLHLMLETTDKE